MSPWFIQGETHIFLQEASDCFLLSQHQIAEHIPWNIWASDLPNFSYILLCYWAKMKKCTLSNMRRQVADAFETQNFDTLLLYKY